MRQPNTFALVLTFLFLTPSSFAQGWPYYGGDAGGMKYSPLTQINRSNVQQLQVAWTYHTGDLSDGTKYPVLSAFECTPLVVDGTMYLTTPFCRVIALDSDVEGYLRASEVSRDRVEDIRSHLKEGDEVEAKIINIDRKNRSINLSIKAKDLADESDAMQKMANDPNAGSAGTTNLGALLKAKMDVKNSGQ